MFLICLHLLSLDKLAGRSSLCLYCLYLYHVSRGRLALLGEKRLVKCLKVHIRPLWHIFKLETALPSHSKLETSELTSPSPREGTALLSSGTDLLCARFLAEYSLCLFGSYWISYALSKTSMRFRLQQMMTYTVASSSESRPSPYSEHTNSTLESSR
jgi:hypothetical protein